MASSVTDERATALRVAKWLVEKGRPDDAVGLLAAWAAAGPNDADGQGLLAEALRIDPAARIAQMAFERMEGVPGDHGELDAHIKHYSNAELQKLEAEMKRPSFRRAQMGFNNNIKFQDQVFHVQTEDLISRTSSRTFSPTGDASSRATSGHTRTKCGGATSPSTCAGS
jgi:hypothetical protein